MRCIALILLALTLAGCEQAYDCNTREASATCSIHLEGTGVSVTEFVTIDNQCGVVIRSNASYLRTTCVAGFYTDIPLETFTGCIPFAQNYTTPRHYQESFIFGLLQCVLGDD